MQFIEHTLIAPPIYIWYRKEYDRLSRDVQAILNDYDNQS
jgi:hypothetical protein